MLLILEVLWEMSVLLGERNPSWWQCLDCIPSKCQGTILLLTIFGHKEWSDKMFSGILLLNEEVAETEPDGSWCQKLLGTKMILLFPLLSFRQSKTSKYTGWCYRRRGFSLEMVSGVAEQGVNGPLGSTHCEQWEGNKLSISGSKSSFPWFLKFIQASRAH